MRAPLCPGTCEVFRQLGKGFCVEGFRVCKYIKSLARLAVRACGTVDASVCGICNHHTSQSTVR